MKLFVSRINCIVANVHYDRERRSHRHQTGRLRNSVDGLLRCPTTSTHCSIDERTSFGQLFQHRLPRMLISEVSATAIEV
eukprot:scaffold1177_cov192-Alexandrium_tamarense.AAC.13